MHNIEINQAKIKHETTTENSTSITNPKIRAEINFRLGNELNEIILSPVVGVQKVRKVLNRYALDIPALYDLEYEGDEIVLEMDQFGQVQDQYFMPQFKTEDPSIKYYLYLLYALMDDGKYDFYAEITDQAGIDEILSEEDDDEDEDDEEDDSLKK